MLQFDQESQPARRSALGPSGRGGGSDRLLDTLAREIEDTQRQQSETLAHIVERLRSFDVGRTTAAPQSRRRQYMTLEEAGDEPWDVDTAEALMRACEDDLSRPYVPTHAAISRSQQEWIGERFNDVTQRITQALSDLKPANTVAALEERLDSFQKLISSELEDVVRRADLEGLRLIEVHVNDLGDKLDELERHVSRIDGIESDVRSVMEQVSDERIAKLLDYDSRFAADLEAVARRAAEEVHARIGDDAEQAQAVTRRHEELRALIEASIQDRREAEAQATSLVTGLTGRVSAQSDRYDELKSLLEQAIQEQRQNEQTAFGMLDTLQQALITVLDRMDALEQHHAAVTPARPAPEQPVLAPPPSFASPYAEESAPSSSDPGSASDAPYAFRDTRFDAFSAKDESEPPAPVEIPAAFADVGDAVDAPASDEPESPLDRLRRDFVADARRAKLKATANRAEALGEQQAEPPKAGTVAEARAALTQGTRAPLGGGSGRLFGMSTKLLAGVLALIIAINGALLLLNRKSATPPAAPEIARPSATEPRGTDPQIPGGMSEQPQGTPGPGPRSELGDGETEGHRLLAPYGLHDDVLNPPALDTTGSTTPSDIPRGMTIAQPVGSLTDAAVADVYEQQVLASLSGKLGMIAAGRSADALLPEKSGRIDAAYSTPELFESGEGAASESALDLPPATVGPTSLRLAAANGDASAEFEVAARLAEGKGTGQDYAEALRWYQRSAAKGFAQAQYRLGTLYERGLGVTKDIERAKIWYARAAEGGNVKAMHNLAVLSAGGEAGEPDYDAAQPWFLKAAEHGLADSQYNLGVLLENGFGGKTDRVAAYKWYALAAKDGDPDAVMRRDALKRALGAAELKSAEEMIATFRPRPASPLANDARAAGEDWKKRAQNDTNT
ncbi:hypothetical protein [Hyphomicrobium sp.]|uniref:hypothetical protein n=1 Tax=Hyphomicrobium sp. TaxID=82 RepID=UPI0025B91411|nr:hypothetical protein [Hyphomicrobium sp.]MCC7253365.1 SEL1-like repeat protein [Hyphomicrobium sp.]